MADEITAAVQIVRLSYDGVELGVRAMKGTMGAIAGALKLLVAMVDHDKAYGKTSMKKLLRNGSDLQVMELASKKDLQKAKRLCKKYGILYSVVPSKEDATHFDLLFHTDSLSRANRVQAVLNSAKVKTLEEHVGSMPAAELKGQIDFIQEQSGRGPFARALARKRLKASQAEKVKQPVASQDELREAVECVKQLDAQSKRQAEEELARASRPGMTFERELVEFQQQQEREWKKFVAVDFLGAAADIGEASIESIVPRGKAL